MDQGLRVWSGGLEDFDGSHEWSAVLTEEESMHCQDEV